MSNTIDGAGGVAPPQGGPAPAARVRRAGDGESGFAAALRREETPAEAEAGGAGAADSALGEAMRDAARGIDRGQRMVDSVIRAARSGRVFSQEELIAIQAGVYRYTQELELASKLVDKATGAVRQTLQSQQ